MTQQPVAITPQRIERINKRWSNLNDLLLASINEGMKFLLLANSGGCVAMLAFIGTAEEIRRYEWPWWVLGLFFLGVVFIGLLHFARYHSLDISLKGWDRDIRSYYEGKKTWENVSADDDKRVDSFYHIQWLAHLSFLCFVGGGAVGFFCYQDIIKGKVDMSKWISVDPGQKNHVPKAPPEPPPQPSNQ